MTAWIRLEGPHTSLNAPNVTRMQLATNPVVPWSAGSAAMMGLVDVMSRHLVINCHGTPMPADLHLGVGLTLNNVNAFDALGLMPRLRVIWISACNLAGSGAGHLMCQEMAGRAAAYVVAAVAPVFDLPAPPGCVEDYVHSTPVYFDPNGTTITREAFFQQGQTLRFRRG